ncbi:MAG TPA: acyltransferase [Longimicrobium sp.]|nr:acyltransferase [Longimicrobium sp.]
MSESSSPPAPYTVHPSAIVDEGAEIGAGTRIWHFSHVSAGSRIGARCSLGQNVFVAPRVTVGNGVKIQNNVSLYEGVVLEDYVFCGPSMVFTNVRTPRSAFPRNTSADYAETRVGRGASIGANATIVCGTTIGEWSFVAAGAVVTRDVAPYALMVGVPARRVGWVCECGATLALEDGKATCAQCGRGYREDWRSAPASRGGPGERLVRAGGPPTP